MVELSALRHRSDWRSRDRIAMDSVPQREPTAGASPLRGKKPVEVRGIPAIQQPAARGAQPPAHRKEHDERGTDCILDPGSEDEESVPGPPARRQPGRPILAASGGLALGMAFFKICHGIPDPGLDSFFLD